jgi:ubiquinone/menaquinone biosynthesis C-methylase UbiE
MITLARKRLKPHGSRVRLWVGDASAISAPADSYEAVFDFGIIHHIAVWRRAVEEVHRVLKPGGHFYAEEVLERFILHPISRRLLDHPLQDRFDAAGFTEALGASGFEGISTSELWNSFAWFAARKPGAAPA